MNSERPNLIKPMTEQILHGVETAYVFMSSDNLLRELQAIREALLKSGSLTYDKLPTKDEAIEIAHDFKGLFEGACEPQPSVLSEKLAHLRVTQRKQLCCQLLRVERAIAFVQDLSGEDFEPTNVFAVSPTWCARWCSLISGGVYPAYIPFIDTSCF